VALDCQVVGDAFEGLVVEAEHVVVESLVPASAVLRVNWVDPFFLGDPLRVEDSMSSV
jgi:hypothetical protein